MENGITYLNKKGLKELFDETRLVETIK